MNRRKRFVPHQWVQDALAGLFFAAVAFAFLGLYLASSGWAGVRP